MIKIFQEQQITTEDVFYSYWFDEWAFVLSVLKKAEYIPTFITRAHRFDIYENLGQYKRHLYKPFVLNEISRVFSISEDGASYMRALYPKYSYKIGLSRLGTQDHVTNEGPVSNDGTRIIVSCSNVIAIKRVEDIARTIYSIPNVKWVHFGTGKLFDQLKETCDRLKKENPSFDFELRGQVKNSDVLGFYKTNSVSLFVNFSTSEGIPVSIMEAMSFGIPCIAPDVGGISELVNATNGQLLNAQAGESELRSAIDGLLNKSESQELSKNARNFWKSNYSADSNYQEFVQLLK